MPELPEVETVRGRLLAPAIGARIAAVWDSGMPLHMKRRPPRKKLQSLVGAKLTARAAARQVPAPRHRSPRRPCSSTSATGRLCIYKKGEPRAAHTHLVLDLGKRELRFMDARRFGQLDVLARADERAHPALAVLGPDALVHGVDPEALLAVARRRQRTTLKAFLLDQSVIAGVGNIYASEALARGAPPVGAGAPLDRRARPQARRRGARGDCERPRERRHDARRLRRGRRHEGRQRGLSMGLRSRGQPLSAVPGPHPPVRDPGSSNVFLSNVCRPRKGSMIAAFVGWPGRPGLSRTGRGWCGAGNSDEVADLAHAKCSPTPPTKT